MRWVFLLCAACGRLEFDATTTVDAARGDASIDAAVIVDDPIGYWPFDEANGIIAFDASGHGHNGMLTAMVTRVVGHVGEAVSFNGVDDEEVDLGLPAALELTGSMSVTAWVNASAYHLGDPTDDVIIGRDTTDTGWSLKGTEDCGPETFAFQVGITEGTTSERCSMTIAITGVWYHVAGVYDAQAQTMDIYVNGTLDSGMLMGAAPPAQHQSNDPINIEIGNTNPLAPPSGGGSTWQGAIDEVRMYDRPLTAAEVAVLAH